MKKIVLILITTILVFSPLNIVFANDNRVEQSQIKIQVNGIVCSFCAHGVYKNLVKLDFLDPTQFKNGVHMNINDQMITLAVNENQNVSLKDTYDLIIKGGYEPVKFQFFYNGETINVDFEIVSEVDEFPFKDLFANLKLMKGTKSE